MAFQRITIVFIALGLYLIPPLIEWATVKAVWSAPDGALCREHQDGACWAFIWQKLGYSVTALIPRASAGASTR